VLKTQAVGARILVEYVQALLPVKALGPAAERYTPAMVKTRADGAGCHRAGKRERERARD
jgi:hypothetical protein